MKVEVRSLGGHLASTAWVALRTFAVTLFVMTLLGCALAAVSSYFLRDYHWAYGAIAAALAVIEAVAIGIFLGCKRALALAVAHGLGKLRLGRALTGLLFERMLATAQGAEHGERGGRVVQGLEKLPLAQAETLLGGAVSDLTGGAEQRGWLRRTLRALMLRLVRTATLARFREEGAKHGGIDLLKVRQELEQTVDEKLAQKVRGGLRLWTLFVILGLPVVVALQTALLRWWLHAQQ